MLTWRDGHHQEDLCVIQGHTQTTGCTQQRLTKMPVLPEKDISRRAVTRPPSLMSCPALIFRCRKSCCVASQAPFRAEGATSGTSSPTCMLQGKLSAHLSY